MASLNESKALAIQYVDEHRFLADYTKPLVKDVVVRHFQSLSNAIAAIELVTRRTEAAMREKRQPKSKLGIRKSNMSREK